MKQYDDFSAADFACDEDFFRWVKYPDRFPRLDAFWQNFVKEYPEKKECIEEARTMILAVLEESQFIPDDETQSAVWERIRQNTDLDIARRPSPWSSWYARAAVVLVAISLTWAVAQKFKTQSATNAYTAESSPGFVKQINNTDKPRTVILGDGTSIILQPQSVLEYPETFALDTREVILTGEGYFEVAHDINRPFLVKADDLVTRVLGTSFIVRNVAGENNVLVRVKTGKVSVFRAEEASPSQRADKKVEGVVLMPNQQVLYERDEMKMTKSLVENPSVLIPLKKHEFEFVDTPIRDVFRAIELAYGVDIVFDEEALSECYLNASLSDVALYDKLKLICKGINASYEIIDSHIIIYGRGCAENL